MNVVEFVDITNDEDILKKIGENEVEIIASVVDQRGNPISEVAQNAPKHRDVTLSFNDTVTEGEVPLFFPTGFIKRVPENFIN